MGEQVLNPSTGEVFKAADPNISPAYALPGDFAAQYPTPLDPTEIIAMCEEISLWQYIPEQRTGLKQEMWRELNELEFTSGSSYIAFGDGLCPEEYRHDGDNTTVTLKNLGAKKTLGISDIMHSNAVAMGYGDGINALVGAAPAGEGLPGGANLGTFQRQTVADLKAKEIRLGMTLVLNGYDAMLVNGDTNTNALEFDGIENWATNMSCTMHTNDNSASGTFSATSFDRWLSESCAKPTVLMGHPQIMQELMSSYFQLGFQGAEVVSFADGNRITPGFNFAGYVNTGVGRLQVVSDNNFRRTAAGSSILQADIWALRMVHNGEPLVYRSTQIPLGLRDLTPGCTAIAFEIWTKTALIIRTCCAHGRYQSQFSGRSVSTCSIIG